MLLRLQSGALKNLLGPPQVYDQADHGAKPMFFAKKKRESNAPQEKTALTESIAVGVWRGKDRNGSESYRFSLDRIDDQGVIRRTFRPEHLCQMPEAFLKLAKAFADAPGVDAAVQTELARLATCIEFALHSDTVNGSVKEGTQTNGRIFGS